MTRPCLLTMHDRSFRLLHLLAANLLLVGCAGGLDNVKHGAQQAFRNTLAVHFSRQFFVGVDLVIQALAAEGGYLDNPLVRILLPPPVGLVIDVARDLHRNPKAALLETLINRAAEHAVPGAGPILQSVLREMDQADARGLFAAGRTATTDYLREKAGGAVHNALQPMISERLEMNGAVELYEELLQDPDIAALAAGAPHSTLPPVTPNNLDDYVTRKAVDGLFKMLEQRESSIRESISRIPMPAGSTP